MKLSGTLFCFSLLLTSSLAISSYLNEQDQSRLKDILVNGLSNEDVGILNHTVRGLALFGTAIPNSKDKLCQKISTQLNAKKPETLFHITKAGTALGCSLKLPLASPPLPQHLSAFSFHLYSPEGFESGSEER